ncbi:MAG: thiamine transport system substrate-binding protein [Chloroflexi bacterium]|nr:MAG: thiamine transport system substrate-binding protein [Chloroflexota bacterium]
MKKLFLFGFFVTVLLALTSCAPKVTGPVRLTVMTHDSFAVSQELVTKFETENNVKLIFLKSGDTGSALNRAILTKNSPQADVFYGVDNTFLSRAIAEDLFEAYDSPMLKQIPDEFKLAAGNEALPVDYGDVCINYDKAYFLKNNLAVPQTLSDLLKPEYGKKNGKEGLLVVENPATSSPGLAFLLATIAEFGPDHYLEFWQSLKDNGIVVVNDWGTAYYTNFSASSGKGAQPMVVSYASSPVAEVVFAELPLAEAPTSSIIGPNTCFRQIEFVGILKGTKNKALAQKFVDFMLSQDFQADMPLQMFVYPVNPAASLPPEFVKFSQSPAKPASMDPETIAQNRDAWIQAWSEVVLR